MDIKDLKLVSGELSVGKPACIHFYGEVNEWTTSDFNSQFLYIQEFIKPSKITVCINSEGGSVIYGMGTYSIIQDCPIDTETIVDGIAASMGSVIWAAGKKGFMRDYSIMMIHNPFNSDGDDEDDKDAQECTNAFRKQICKIYQSRFGLSEEAVKSIMDGEEGIDGTYLDAEKAVALGILSESHIIASCKQTKDEVKAKIVGVKDVAKVRAIMSEFAEVKDENKLIPKDEPIPSQINIINKNNKEMEKVGNEQHEDLQFGLVCDQLGFDKGTTAIKITNRINELMKVEADLKAANKQIADFEIVKNGLETKVNNANAELKTVKDALKVYQDAEEAAKNASIEAMVTEAIEKRKISVESKDSWINMAKNNLELAKSTLDSIPASDKISDAIATDPSNVKEAKDNINKAEKDIETKIAERVGNEFKFKKAE